MQRKTKKCENSSVGRAQPCQGWGRGFESRFPLYRKTSGAYSLKHKKHTGRQTARQRCPTRCETFPLKMFQTKQDRHMPQRRNGGIGRHEGLKIPWPEMAVRVRVPLAALFLNSLIFYYEKLSRSHAHSVFTVSTFILL